MSKMDDVRGFLQEIGMPKAQLADLCCLSLLAMARMTEERPWPEATNQWIRIHDIISFANVNYGISYAENSRETFRKQAIHHFRTAAIIEDNNLATNSPNYSYRLTKETLTILHSIGGPRYHNAIKRFKAKHQALVDMYASRKRMTLLPVKINHQNLTFSSGKHNELQKAIIEEFAPRFAPNSECLYVGDTIKKDLVMNVDKLHALGFVITLHDKIPDVILYREDKNWIYFIESVTSVGQIDSKRYNEISDMAKGVTAGLIFVTAFPDFRTYKKFSESLAWETEVWIAELPEHLVHLNGDKFLGPRR